MTTTTKNIDRFGNISYVVEREGLQIGIIEKTCSGYRAVLQSGAWMPASSIKRAQLLLEARA